MSKSKYTEGSSALELLIAEVQQKYHVSREEVMDACVLPGFVRTRLHTYFIVEGHLARKGATNHLQTNRNAENASKSQ